MRSARPALADLGPEVVAALRQRFPELSSGARLAVRPWRTDGTHPMTVVETDTRPVRRLLLKRQHPDRWSAEMRAERFATEWRLLTEIAPAIQAQNPRARCPEVVASDPERQILVLELVEGVTLKSRLARAAGHDARDMLRLCGEWLARFHQLTRSADAGNPFEWIAAALAEPWTRWVFGRYASRDTYLDLCRLADDARRRHADVRQPLCRVHGVFGPHHVLVREGRIYVVDLESSHLGYPCEDLGFFSICGELFVPRPRLFGPPRIDPAEQGRVLIDAYARHAPAAVPHEQAVLLAFARLLGLARFLGSPVSGNYLVGPEGRLPRVKAAVLGLWWRRRITRISRRELAALRAAARE